MRLSALFVCMFLALTFIIAGCGGAQSEEDKIMADIDALTKESMAAVTSSDPLAAFTKIAEKQKSIEDRIKALPPEKRTKLEQRLKEMKKG
jgi:uncharacterized protein YdcH (DUF465 family)